MLLVQAVLVAFFLSAPAAGNLVVIDQDAEECFAKEVLNGTEIRFLFEVLEGGFYDISVEITAPNNRKIYEVQRQSGGAYIFDAEMSGTYQFCFNNRKASATQKVVNITLDISEPPKQAAMETEWSNMSLASAGEIMAAVLRLEIAVNTTIRLLQDRVSRLERTVEKMRTARGGLTTYPSEDAEG
ncbi:transmembrane emp24 domain-containing protein 2-like [Hemicordylus capensis]|uniref:transmembrane emp24 domain-containing protein 2-like n=1 Tax=Hemicordylus capensis TaxID=884348 RepID=UPI0023040DF7|nr:transmembrane emp24 domain-containing protein 2-like [Hemicordylus capensis]XP_053136070.1 transmembrane emp24 domain-containing protein 2-like [Hemicordylus capensis]